MKIRLPRSLRSLALGGLALGLALGACTTNPAADVPPRLIAGGGVSDGPIDGRLNIHVIGDGDVPLANARVHVGNSADGKTQDSTDETGLVVFTGLSGPQTVSVTLSGYTSRGWVGVNGANVTIPMAKLASTTADTAMLSGTIEGFEAIVVPADHQMFAVVLQSSVATFGDPRNLVPNQEGACAGAPCAWSLTSHTGPVTLTAAIIDQDSKGTLEDNTDDTYAVIAWAWAPSVTVQKGVNQSGIVLSIIEAGNLQELTVDVGAPPAGLPRVGAFPFIEMGQDEFPKLVSPQFLASFSSQPAPTSVLAPKPSVFGGTTYRLAISADENQTNQTSGSVIDLRGVTTSTLAAGTWLAPPTDLMLARTTASFTPATGANIHRISYRDASGRHLLDLRLFDPAQHALDIPAPLQPTIAQAGALTGTVLEILRDEDPNNFSGAVAASVSYSYQLTPVQME